MGPSAWVVLATVDRSRGRRGEVLASSWSGGPETFQDRIVSIVLPNHPVREARIEEAWEHGGRIVLKLEGVDSIEAAEALRGAELCVRPEDRLPLAEGEYYLSDLIGCTMYDAGKPVGEVTGWQESPGAVLLTVRHGSRESLVPLVSAICTSVDPSNRRIDANLPEGLLDL